MAGVGKIYSYFNNFIKAIAIVPILKIQAGAFYITGCKGAIKKLYVVQLFDTGTVVISVTINAFTGIYRFFSIHKSVYKPANLFQRLHWNCFLGP